MGGWQPEAGVVARAASRRQERTSSKRLRFADQPPPSPASTAASSWFRPDQPPPSPADTSCASSWTRPAVDDVDADGPVRAPLGAALEIEIDAAQIPKVSKQRVAFGRVVRERQDVEAYVPPPKSLTLDPTTGAPVFRSPASRKKYGWAATPKQQDRKVDAKVRRVMDALPAPPSVSKYVADQAEDASVIRPADFDEVSCVSPPPEAPAFLTAVDGQEARSPLGETTNLCPKGGQGSAIEAVRTKREQLQKERARAKAARLVARQVRFAREKRCRKLLVAVTIGRATMELANRYILRKMEDEDVHTSHAAQRTLARFYRGIMRRRRLYAAATLARARSLAVTIRLRCVAGVLCPSICVAMAFGTV